MTDLETAMRFASITAACALFTLVMSPITQQIAQVMA